MKKFAILALLAVSVSQAADVSHREEGISKNHISYLGSELCKVRNALIDQLSHDLNCTAVEVDYAFKKRGLFGYKNDYRVEVAARCPKIAAFSFEIGFSECEECVGEVNVFWTSSSGSKKTVIVETPMPKYMCHDAPR